MRLEIRRRGVQVTEGLRAYLKERLRLALGQFARHINRVRVYLRDANGPRGGLGKKCRVVVELPPRGRVVVAGADMGISGAIARTAGRAGLAVKRHVRRRRTRRRQRRSLPFPSSNLYRGGNHDLFSASDGHAPE
ncbi:MAG TPA: HPF/RaiA family ribosome-associated protein [Gemmataceae bacterium]|nr:HPF/RaiA family ribosome-associated protein [Gemmataceae bacterium]